MILKTQREVRKKKLEERKQLFTREEERKKMKDMLL